MFFDWTKLFELIFTLKENGAGRPTVDWCCGWRGSWWTVLDAVFAYRRLHIAAGTARASSRSCCACWARLLPRLHARVRIGCALTLSAADAASGSWCALGRAPLWLPGTGGGAGTTAAERHGGGAAAAQQICGLL